jgi:hypothetical protein
VESEDIGTLTKIRIGHDNSGFGAAWFLDKVSSLASTNISSNVFNNLIHNPLFFSLSRLK